MPQKEQKIAAAVYLYQADNDGEWGELRFDFENGTAEIVKLADWDTMKSNIFAKTVIRFVQRLPEARLLKSVVVPSCRFGKAGHDYPRSMTFAQNRPS